MKDSHETDVDEMGTNLISAPVAGTIQGDDVTHVIFILDRSGSMAGREPDVIGAFGARHSHRIASGSIAPPCWLLCAPVPQLYATS